MNIVDSSAWLEYFEGSKNAAHFAEAIKNYSKLIVPTIILYEVFKKILQQKSENDALQSVAHMKQGQVVDIDMELALLGAKLSSELKLPMADSIILATSQKHKAIIWTQDNDFKGLKNVKYFEKT